MLRMQISSWILLTIVTGCTSFRTTALTRLDNDSVVPECRKCNKLNGLPVKLKVPSHVVVTIYEQQLILANSAEKVASLTLAVQQSYEALKAANSKLEELRSGLSDAEAEAKAAKAALEKSIERRENAEQELQADPSNLQLRATLDAAKKVEKSATERLAKAEEEKQAAKERVDQDEEAFRKNVEKAGSALAAAKKSASVGYTLVSFTPAQLIVETNLEYTDKVFMVDFRRPAGGILDLSEASMDDEQYFAKIQADVTERTMADVSTAIKTLQGPLSSGAKKSKDNAATPTSASTPEGEQSNTVNFQKSVVAFKRFDISEPCWEERMMEFVNSRLYTPNSQLDAPYTAGTSDQIDTSSGYAAATLSSEPITTSNDESPDVGHTTPISDFVPPSNVPAVPYAGAGSGNLAD